MREPHALAWGRESHKLGSLGEASYRNVYHESSLRDSGADYAILPTLMHSPHAEAWGFLMKKHLRRLRGV